MFTEHLFTAEFALQRQKEMLQRSERHHRLFRRPVLVESGHRGTVRKDAPVIAMPTPRPRDRSPEVRVA